MACHMEGPVNGDNVPQEKALLPSQLQHKLSTWQACSSRAANQRLAHVHVRSIVPGAMHD